MIYHGVCKTHQLGFFWVAVEAESREVGSEPALHAASSRRETTYMSLATETRGPLLSSFSHYSHSAFTTESIASVEDYQQVVPPPIHLSKF